MWTRILTVGKSLLRFKWIPIALIGIPAVLGGTWLIAYQKGLAEGKYAAQLDQAEAVNQALADQQQRMRALHRRDLQIVTASALREQEIRRNVIAIETPVATPDCVDLGPEWLRAYAEGVLATGATGADF